MTKSLLEKNKEFILFLNSLSPTERSKILKNLGSQYINTICEIFSNFLKQNLTTCPKTISKVKKYKNYIRNLTRKRHSLSLKRKHIASKKGGAILSVLLPLAASLIGSLIGR